MSSGLVLVSCLQTSTSRLTKNWYPCSQVMLQLLMLIPQPLNVTSGLHQRYSYKRDCGSSRSGTKAIIVAMFDKICEKNEGEPMFA